jgi:quinol monooxygenase YgiN
MRSMSIYTICREIIPSGRLDASLVSLREAEARFTREAGVLEREFFQCAQQPHVIWACTEWTDQKAHDDAARAIMTVREDDRVAAAYFRPGLYFEIFALPVDAGTRAFSDGESRYVVVAHALVEDRRRQGWEERLSARLEALPRPRGLLRIRTYRNYCATNELVAFFEWSDAEMYDAERLAGKRTVEEHILVEERRSDLAGYDQFECLPLEISAS